jgi:sulfite reductase subunit C
MDGNAEIDYEELKKGGYIVQRDPDYFTVRLRVPGGVLTSKQLIALGKIASKYGRGRVHLTTRQGVQIPYVDYNKLGEITEELKEIGMPPGSCGPRVRNISACVGLPECPQANINTYKIAKKIDERYFGRVLPTKIKIGITGCPNSCAKPQLNDIGIMGVVKPKIIDEKCNGCGFCVTTCREGAIKIVDGKAVIDYNRCIYCGDCIRVCPQDADVIEKRGYTIFIGGNVGRHPRLAHKIITFADEETVFRVIENSLKIFEEEASRKERFGHLIDRLGIGEFLRRLLSWL